jgi:hypothetical protein
MFYFVRFLKFLFFSKFLVHFKNTILEKFQKKCKWLLWKISHSSFLVSWLTNLFFRFLLLLSRVKFNIFEKIFFSSIYYIFFCFALKQQIHEKDHAICSRSVCVCVCVLVVVVVVVDRNCVCVCVNVKVCISFVLFRFCHSVYVCVFGFWIENFQFLLIPEWGNEKLRIMKKLSVFFLVCFTIYNNETSRYFFDGVCVYVAVNAINIFLVFLFLSIKFI